MLSKEDNELLTRVGPGTAMGELLRRYWMPALLSWEIPEPDCPPVRVKLLGESLVAFRTTDGRIGLLEEFCAHRRTSLWLGRNEQNGLRCVFHGWKFDVRGQCVDQMNEPEQFASKVRVTAYPTVELGGVVWAYMGPKDKQPAPPEFELTQVPETHREVTKGVQECNWLQALEGGVDTSHFAILHRALKDSPLPGVVEVDSVAVKAGAPTLEVDLTDYGYRYFGVRPLDADSLYIRGYHFVMPFTQLRPPGPGKQQVHGHYYVPMDDETCMVWNWYYNYDGEPLTEEHHQWAGGNEYGTHIDVNNGFRPIRNRTNDWMIDRKIQKTETFSGIDGINQQDRAAQESMGPIVDRTREHLGPADKAIIVTRKLLLDAVRAVQDNRDPPGLAPTYYELRAAECVSAKGGDWRQALLPLMYPETRGHDSAPAEPSPRRRRSVAEAAR